MRAKEAITMILGYMREQDTSADGSNDTALITRIEGLVSNLSETVDVELGITPTKSTVAEDE